MDISNNPKAMNSIYLTHLEPDRMSPTALPMKNTPLEAIFAKDAPWVHLMSDLLKGNTDSIVLLCVRTWPAQSANLPASSLAS